MSSERRLWYRGIVPVGVVLVALVLRIWGLGMKSFWRDEAVSLFLANQPVGAILTNVTETNPPLYYVLLHGWIKVFGMSEFALRSLSAIFGVCAVFLMGWVGHLLGGRRLAWLAMGVIAVMPMPIEFSQMARGYSLFLAASIASYGCLLAWEEQPRRRWAAGYVATTLLMGYAHNYAVFNLLAQHLYMGCQVVRRRVPLRGWAGLSTAVLLGYLPWLFVMALQVKMLHQQGFWIPKPLLEDLPEIVRQYVVVGVRPQLMWIYVILAGLGWFTFQSEAGKTRHWSGGLMLLWAICPIAAPFVWSRFFTPMLWPRYTIAAAAALYLLVARGFLAIPWRLARWATGAMLSIIAALSLSHYYPMEYENWRSLVSTVSTVARPGDIIGAPFADSWIAFGYYYRGRLPVCALPDGVGGFSQTELDQLLHDAVAGHKRFWCIIREGKRNTEGRLLTEVFVERYPKARLIYEHRFSGNLFLYGYDLQGIGAV